MVGHVDQPARRFARLAARRDSSRTRAARRWAKLSLAAALSLAFGAAFAAPALAAPEASRCGQTPQSPTPGADDSPRSELTRDDPIRVAFDGHRGRTDRAVTVTAMPPLRATAMVVAEVESDFERGDGGDTFPLEGTSVAASVTTGGNIRLVVCLDADRPEHVEPGRYLGSIRLSGSEVSPTALPIEVTLKDPGAVALAWIVLGLVLGIAFKTATDFNANAKKLEWEGLKDYLTQPAFLLAVLTGIAAGFITYTQLYAASAIWGTTDDHVKLMLAGVAVQVTGMTASDLVSPYEPGRGIAGAGTADGGGRRAVRASSPAAEDPPDAPGTAKPTGPR